MYQQLLVVIRARMLGYRNARGTREAGLIGYRPEEASFRSYEDERRITQGSYGAPAFGAPIITSSVRSIRA